MARAIAGVFLTLLGAVWFGQGIGKIHGSFMTDQSEWSTIGAVTVALGLALVASAIRSRRKRTAETR